MVEFRNGGLRALERIAARSNEAASFHFIAQHIKTEEFLAVESNAEYSRLVENVDLLHNIGLASCSTNSAMTIRRDRILKSTMKQFEAQS